LNLSNIPLLVEPGRNTLPLLVEPGRNTTVEPGPFDGRAGPLVAFIMRAGTQYEGRAGPLVAFRKSKYPK
jgi:hypothetical protein